MKTRITLTLKICSSHIVHKYCMGRSRRPQPGGLAVSNTTPYWILKPFCHVITWTHLRNIQLTCNEAVVLRACTCLSQISQFIWIRWLCPEYTIIIWSKLEFRSEYSVILRWSTSPTARGGGSVLGLGSRIDWRHRKKRRSFCKHDPVTVHLWWERNLVRWSPISRSQSGKTFKQWCVFKPLLNSWLDELNHHKTTATYVEYSLCVN